MPHSYEMTLIEAVSRLGSAGFHSAFRVVPRGAKGIVACGDCGALVSASAVEVVELLRLEGDTDPDEEILVAGVRCPRCGVAGVLIATYGPTADPADADVVAALRDGRPETRHLRHR